MRFCLTCVALERDGRQGRVQAPVVASPGRLSGRAVDVVRRSGASKRDGLTVIESRGDWVGPGRSNQTLAVCQMQILKLFKIYVINSNK